MALRDTGSVLLPCVCLTLTILWNQEALAEVCALMSAILVVFFCREETPRFLQCVLQGLVKAVHMLERVYQHSKRKTQAAIDRHNEQSAMCAQSCPNLRQVIEIKSAVWSR